MSLERHEITRALDLSGKKHGLNSFPYKTRLRVRVGKRQTETFFDFLFQGRRAPCQDRQMLVGCQKPRESNNQRRMSYITTMITDATDFFCLKGFSEVEIEWACCCMKH